MRIAWSRLWQVFIDRDREYAKLGWLYIFWSRA